MTIWRNKKNLFLVIFDKLNLQNCYNYKRSFSRVMQWIPPIIPRDWNGENVSELRARVSRWYAVRDGR